MKKRILAMLLALVMVVSLLPMTVLAAETVCPEDHNLSNCPNNVFVETVAPTCGTWGYDAFKCLDCGVIFADNFVAPATVEHTLEKVAEVPADCLNAGVMAHEKCTVCAALVLDGKVVKAEDLVIKALGHDFGLESEETKCYEKCTRCGEINPDVDNHVWSEHPTNIVPPTGCQHGVATYTCVNCGATKEVDVWPNGDCELEEVKEVLPTCTETGVMAHEKCENCGQLYLNGERVKAEDLVIEALGHVEVESAKNEKCEVTITCERCKVVLETEVRHDWNEEPEIFVAPTCTKWGFEVYVCRDCGIHKEFNNIEPTGHTRPELAEDYEVVTKATCTKDGLATWTCLVCGEELSEVLPALGHDIQRVEVPATCTYYGYTVVYCANGALCDAPCGMEDCSGKTKWGKSWTADFNGDGVEETLNIAEAMHQFYPEMSVRNRRIHNVIIDVEGGLGENNHVEDLARREWINEGDCTNDGDYVFYCEYCDFYEVKVWDAPGHTWDEGVMTTKPTCTTKGKTTYTCTVCNSAKVVTDIDKLGHNPQGDILTKEPTCVKDGCTYQLCLECGAEVPIKVLPKITYKLGDYYTSLEEMSHHRNVKFVEHYREGSCTILGLDKYYCSDCKNYVLLAVEGTGNGHVQPEWDADEVIVKAPNGATAIFTGPIAEGQELIGLNGWVTIRGKAPTCTEAGFTSQYVCLRCLECIESEEIEATGHTLSELVEEVPATCGKAGMKAHYTCSVCEGYVDAEGKDTTKEALIIAKLGHDYKLIDSRVGDCIDYGYRHYQCARCDKEYINRYVEATGHSLIGHRTEATCTENGFQKDYCMNPGCGYTYKEVLFAVGHTDAEGNHFWGYCDDETAATECVICGKIETLHRNVKSETVAATCVDYAYTIHYCTACDWQEVVQDTIAGLGDHTWAGRGMDGWTTLVPATYHEGGVEERECLVCGHYETRPTEPMLGIGLNMTVDNAVVAGAAICDSSLIKVTVTVDANNIDAWGYNFTVNYDADVLEFVSADFSGSVFNVNGFSTTAENAEGVVRVAANCANTENGRTQNININEEMILVDLYFRVHNVGEGLTELNIYTARFINKDGEDAFDYVQGAIAEVEIDEFLDINNDGDFDVVDCQVAYKILIGEPLEGNEEPTIYDATIDVDKDGEITAADIQMLYNYLVGNYSYEDMIECGVEVDE